MADICIWNKCNNRCIMCSNPRDFNESVYSELYSWASLAERIEVRSDNFKKKRETLGLTGGEPTIHPDFFKILYFLKKKFPGNEIVLATNGRMFSYYKFAQKHLPFLDDIKIAIHGFDSKSHDFITGVKGSFKQTIEGIKNIFAVRKNIKNGSFVEVEIRVILTKLNYQKLERIFGFLYKNFSEAEKIVLIFPEFEGICQENFSVVGITYKDALPEIQIAVNNWADRFKEIRLYHFPLCVLSPNLWPYAWRTLRKEEVVFLDRCGECAYQKYCLGIHVDYPKVVGDGEFQPISALDAKLEVNIEKDFIHHPILSVKT